MDGTANEGNPGAALWARELKNALILLASSADVQIATLARMGGHVDELGLEFDDAFRGWLPIVHSTTSKEDIALVELIDTKLDQMSGPDNMSLWTTDSLCSDQRWQELRDLARRALSTHLFR